MQVQPYIFFNGQCEEALEFYKKTLGAEVDALMRFKEAPEAAPPGMIAPEWGDKVMHSSFRIGDSAIMASDGMGPKDAAFKGIELTLTVESEADADRLFGALAEGGKVQMPMSETFFAKRFGSVADRFGVSWMVTTAA